MLMAAKNNRHLNIMPPFFRGLACLASGYDYAVVRTTAKKLNFPELESHAKPKKRRTKLRCLAACREELKGVRNSTFGRESLLQSAALVWTTDLPLIFNLFIRLNF